MAIPIQNELNTIVGKVFPAVDPNSPDTNASGHVTLDTLKKDLETIPQPATLTEARAVDGAIHKTFFADGSNWTYTEDDISGLVVSGVFGIAIGTTADTTGASGGWLRRTDALDIDAFVVSGESTFNNALTRAKALQDSMGGLFPVYTNEAKVYDSTLTNFNSFTGWIDGLGQVDTVAGRLPKRYRQILSRPSNLSSPSSFLTAFDGDFAGECVGFVLKNDALGSSPSGYVFTPETSPYYSYVRMESGANGSSGSDSDRTGFVTNRHVIEMRGQGDAIVHNAQVGVYVGRSAAANHLEYPAGVLYGGAVNAYADNVSLAWGESHLSDNGYQARGTGPFIRFTRNNNGETKGEWWNGIRLSSNGTYPVDAAYQAVGKFKVGLDLSMMTNTTAAIALADGQKIEFHSSAPANGISGLQRYAETLNGWDMRYVSAASAIEMRIAATSVFRWSDLGFSILGTRKLFINSQNVLTQRKTGWTVATGTAARTTFDTATVTLEQLAQRVKALIDDLHATAGHGLIGT